MPICILNGFYYKNNACSTAEKQESENKSKEKSLTQLPCRNKHYLTTFRLTRYCLVDFTKRDTMMTHSLLEVMCSHFPICH